MDKHDEKLYGVCSMCGEPMTKPPLLDPKEVHTHRLSECGRYCSVFCVLDARVLFGSDTPREAMDKWTQFLGTDIRHEWPFTVTSVKQIPSDDALKFMAYYYKFDRHRIPDIAMHEAKLQPSVRYVQKYI